MGLFDYVHISDPRIVCSEGHGLCDLEFQTKDLGCTYGGAKIADGKISIADGGYGYPPTLPFLGRISVYTTCEKCPAFVAPKTGNIHGVWVEFKIEIVDDLVRSIVRTSPTTKEWAETTLKLGHMKECAGPMPYDQAVELHRATLRQRWS